MKGVMPLPLLAKRPRKWYYNFFNIGFRTFSWLFLFYVRPPSSKVFNSPKKQK